MWFLPHLLIKSYGFCITVLTFHHESLSHQDMQSEISYNIRPMYPNLLSEAYIKLKLILEVSWTYATCAAENTTLKTVNSKLSIHEMHCP